MTDDTLTYGTILHIPNNPAHLPTLRHIRWRTTATNTQSIDDVFETAVDATATQLHIAAQARAEGYTYNDECLMEYRGLARPMGRVHLHTLPHSLKLLHKGHWFYSPSPTHILTPADYTALLGARLWLVSAHPDTYRPTSLVLQATELTAAETWTITPPTP